MNYIDSSLKVVGSRPIRPDGVDKVTGRAVFAADTRAAGMLWGKVKRSPHAHARIISIDTSKAEALAGVRAVVTAADFPDIKSEEAFVGEGPMNFRDLSLNIMARGKVLYEGHAVAAVAAASQAIADEALELIDVKYEVLPHVIDVEAAMAPDAPVLMAGDFNDWGSLVQNAFESLGWANGAPQACATFPSRLPVVQLDYIYARHLRPVSVQVPRGRIWWRMSDHLPLIAEFAL